MTGTGSSPHSKNVPLFLVFLVSCWRDWTKVILAAILEILGDADPV